MSLQAKLTNHGAAASSSASTQSSHSKNNNLPTNPAPTNATPAANPSGAGRGRGRLVGAGATGPTPETNCMLNPAFDAAASGLKTSAPCSYGDGPAGASSIPTSTLVNSNTTPSTTPPNPYQQSANSTASTASATGSDTTTGSKVEAFSDYLAYFSQEETEEERAELSEMVTRANRMLRCSALAVTNTIRMVGPILTPPPISARPDDENPFISPLQSVTATTVNQSTIIDLNRPMPPRRFHPNIERINGRSALEKLLLLVQKCFIQMQSCYL